MKGSASKYGEKLPGRGATVSAGFHQKLTNDASQKVQKQLNQGTSFNIPVQRTMTRGADNRQLNSPFQGMSNMKSFHQHQGSFLEPNSFKNINQSFNNIEAADIQQTYLIHQNSQSNKNGASMIHFGNSSPQKGSNAHASFSNVYVGQALAASQQRYRENDLNNDVSPNHKSKSKKETTQSSASNIFNQ